MTTQEQFTAFTDWLVTLAVGAMLIALYASWLLSYRAPRQTPTGSNAWFRMSPGGQIAFGMAITIAGGYLCYRIWTPIPIAIGPDVAFLLRLIGLPAIAAGIALWFWARVSLGAMMGVTTSTATQLQIDHRLIVRGAYAFVRHPMYLAYWLLLAGLTITYRTWMPLLTLIGIVSSLIQRARREDEALSAAFGDAWRVYAQHVPGFLPRIGAPRKVMPK